MTDHQEIPGPWTIKKHPIRRQSQITPILMSRKQKRHSHIFTSSQLGNSLLYFSNKMILMIPRGAISKSEVKSHIWMDLPTECCICEFYSRARSIFCRVLGLSTSLRHKQIPFLQKCTILVREGQAAGCR